MAILNDDVSNTHALSGNALNTDVQVIVLAAGMSTRFGGSKMQHRLGNGKTILATTIAQYQKVFANVSVVVPPNERLVNAVTELNAMPVVSHNARQGMSYSIISGINSVPNASAWLIALGDMPYVKSQTLRLLSEQFTPGSIVAPTMMLRQGNPVIFDQRFKKSLLALTGDVGAKNVLHDNSSSVINVMVNDSGVFYDIDRPENILNEPC